MRKSQRQQETLASQTLLDEYLTLKPHRAVQRILTQNDLSYCVELYNLLQQNVKTNTNQLRSVLYSKHQNLHQCSEMIEKIQEFATKIQNIQQEINTCMKTPIVQENYELAIRTELTSIQKIEQFMNQKLFYYALKECKATLSSYGQDAMKNPLQMDSDGYYLEFLKVQIMQKLQEYLQIVPLRREVIAQAINSIQEFMDITPIEILMQYIEESTVTTSQVAIEANSLGQKECTSLLQLLHEKASQFESSYPLPEDKIIEVIFKFKLLSIRQSSQVLLNYQSPEQKISNLYEKVFNYFSDLLQILDEVAKKRNNDSLKVKENIKIQESTLYSIFTVNIQKSVNHISQLFITNQKNQITQGNIGGRGSFSALALTFQSELYEKLLESKEFLSKLNALSEHFKRISRQSMATFSQNQQIPQIQLVCIIENLWRDFYHQMLQIITDKINPSKWYQLPTSVEIPQELAVFSVTQYSKLASEKLSNYCTELEGFKLNFRELLVKSKSIQEKKSIVKYFLRLKSKIDSECNNELKKKHQAISLRASNPKNRQSKKEVQHIINQLLVYYFLVDAYNLSWEMSSTGNISQGQLTSLIKDINLNNSHIMTQQEFSISLFSQIDENHMVYRFIDVYLDMKIPKNRLSESEYIQKWQYQLDFLFAPYCSLYASSNQSLLKDKDLHLPRKESIQQLILALIKTKLYQLEAK